MSELTPLIFPAGKAVTQKPASTFPFSPGDQPLHPSQGGAENRMQQLERMLQEAQGRAEIIEKEAYDNAYLAGEKAGMALGKKRGEQILESLQTSLQSVEQDIATLHRSFAEAAMDVAEHMARQIIGDTISKHPSQLLDIARQAALQLPNTTGLRIAVATDDHASFQRMLDETESSMILRADPGIQPGTCRIISSDQDILIDPVTAISVYLGQIREPMLAPEQPPLPDTGIDEQ